MWGIYIFCALGFVLALGFEWRQIDQSLTNVARERGAVLFRLIELTRDWNARHGGVYVRITERDQPNPYLEHPRRDLTATDGTRLTMINPAYMTRQIAEIAAESEGVHFHITSLKPIRPANAPTDWERETLLQFETGLKERIDFIDGSAPLHRYMAPLLVKQACLACHEAQGYRLGQVRGGISVSMPAADLLELRNAQRLRYVLVYILVFGVLAALAHLFALRVNGYLARLREVTAGQERTIAERTRELTEKIRQSEADSARIAESEERYRSLVDHVQDGVLVVENRRVIFANQRFADMVGHAVDEVVGADMLELLEPPDRPIIAERYDRRMRGETVPDQYRVRLAHAGVARTVVADFWVTPLAPVESKRVLINVHDVTSKLAMEREMQISAAVFENAAEAIVVTDLDGTILRVNPAFTAITGYTPREALGKTPRLLKSGRHDQPFYAEMWSAFKDKGRWEGEIWNRRKNGELYVEWLSITRIADGDAVGGYVATFTDITQRKKAEDAIRHRAHHDALTDLPNRSLFFDRLQSVAATASRYGRQFGLMYVDLDYFKEVNDNHGHAAGDQLLIQTAERLNGCVRQSDTVARMGGDEFAVILAEIESQAEAEDVARRVLQQIGREFVLDAATISISCSIGVAIFPIHDRDMEGLQRKADKALYAAKDAGRNVYRIYSEAGGEGQQAALPL